MIVMIGFAPKFFDAAEKKRIKSLIAGIVPDVLGALGKMSPLRLNTGKLMPTEVDKGLKFGVMVIAVKDEKRVAEEVMKEIGDRIKEGLKERVRFGVDVELVAESKGGVFFV